MERYEIHETGDGCLRSLGGCLGAIVIALVVIVVGSTLVGQLIIDANK